ncbi:MAG: peptide chain release factor 2 [Coriobacteriia bacterium]|nr:peptide chain release factor 2 [Coriobacteriia bacterium]MCL2870714.1 peptide chain release factor 2 [Coriobacteriia bacterium]
MLENRNSEILELRQRQQYLAEQLASDQKRTELLELEKLSAAPNFWNNQINAQSVMGRAAAIRDNIEAFKQLSTDLDDLDVAHDLSLSEDDMDLAAEVSSELKRLDGQIAELEIITWFDDELDSEDAIITITPGQGGLEAQDWTGILFRMYQKYADRQGWKITVHDAPAGEAIGLDRAVFTLSGPNAYGMLRSEVGTHRLVRISPTDIKKRRQTTFAGVSVLPVLPDDIEVDIKDEDIRIDVFRSSGPGGQSVNTTDSAVRITHIPSGIVVTCQNEKSQLQNRESALSILKARLYEEEKARRDAEIEELRGPKTSIAWGTQIRNYVLYPFQLVKDVRTGLEKGNVDAVLDGDIDDFVVSFHQWRAKQSNKA